MNWKTYLSIVPEGTTERPTDEKLKEKWKDMECKIKNSNELLEENVEMGEK